MHYFLGVDGGQSSTVAVVGNDGGEVKGWATAGPCNHVGASEGRAKFLRVVGHCIGQAARMAGIEDERPRFEAACMGMSGGPEDKESLLREMVQTERLVVTHDARIALAGALAGGPGVIVIAGTGSIAFGVNDQGETSRVGGWGHVFGDEGGGFDIVRQAVRAVLREHEGWGPRTALTPALLEAADSMDANALLHLFYTEEWPRSRVAALAVLVSEVAEAGDPVALGILEAAAGQLAGLAGKACARLWREGDARRVSWAGGVFQSGLLLQSFQKVVEADGTTSTASPLHSPVMGALMIAWKMCGVEAKGVQSDVPKLANRDILRP